MNETNLDCSEYRISRIIYKPNFVLAGKSMNKKNVTTFELVHQHEQNKQYS